MRNHSWFPDSPCTFPLRNTAPPLFPPFWWRSGETRYTSGIFDRYAQKTRPICSFFVSNFRVCWEKKFKKPIQKPAFSCEYPSPSLPLWETQFLLSLLHVPRKKIRRRYIGSLRWLTMKSHSKYFQNCTVPSTLNSSTGHQTWAYPPAWPRKSVNWG